MGKYKKKKTKDKRSTSGLMGFLHFIVVLVPLVTYVIFVEGIYPPPHSEFGVFSIFGLILLGLGLTSIVGLLDDNYFGHFITAGVLGIGAIIVSTGLIMMYVPAVYTIVDQYLTGQYFAIIFLLLSFGISYPLARRGVTRALRNQKHSKNKIQALLKGKKNFWWYEDVHNQIGIGSIYWINKLFTSAYVVVFVLHLIVGWWSPVRFVTSIGTALLHFLCSAMLFLGVRECSEDKKTEGRTIIFQAGWAILNVAVGFIIFAKFVIS